MLISAVQQSDSVIYAHIHTHTHIYMGFPGDLVVKNLPANEGDTGSIPWLGRSAGEENSNPLQYWEIPWTDEPGRLQSRGLQRSQT